MARQRPLFCDSTKSCALFLNSFLLLNKFQGLCFFAAGCCQQIQAGMQLADASIEWKAKKEGDKTILSITDNGPGIGAEQAKALFDDSMVSNEKHGLSLHLIRDLAKAIQYKIAVQSEQGRSTTFTLSSLDL